MKPYFAQRPVQYRTTAHLSIHRAIANMPRLAPDDSRYDAMRATWLESGILQPLYVTPADKIVDGRHRWWFAKDMKLTEVPCIEVDDDEAYSIALAGITGRSHATKGQRAYLAFPLLKGGWEAAQQRRIEVLTSGDKRTALPKVATVEDLAGEIGVGEELLRQARRLHEAFKTTPALQATWEPRILDAEEPIGLGAALAGIAGELHTKGKVRPATRNSALRNFEVSWENLIRPASHWERWSDEDRDQASEAIRTSLAKIPTPALDAIAAAVRSAKATHKGASKPDAN